LAELSGTLFNTTLNIGRGNLVVGVDTFGSQGDLSLFAGLMSQSVSIGSDGGTGNLIQYSGSWMNSGDVHVGADAAGNAGSGTITILKGSATVQGTLKIWNTPGTSVTLQAATPDYVSPFLHAAALVNDATMTVAGGAVTTGFISGTGTLTVAAEGTAAGSATADYVRQDSLTIGNGGVVQVRASGGAGGVSHLKDLSIAPNGRFDLNDNDLIVEYTGPSPFTQIKQWVNNGFSTTLDPNIKGIVSTTGQQGGGIAVLALFDNAYLNAPSFNGQTLTSTSVVGKYTYFGDVNLDGQVTGDDYTVIDSNLNTTPPIGAAWISGDANMDGQITGDDYTTIDSKLGTGVGNPLSPSSLAAVPEPTALLALPALLLMARRRRATL
jgi:hypothetical protein